MTHPDITDEMPLGLVRKIRDAYEKDLLFYCSPEDPDDDRTIWIGRMIQWADRGESAYAQLRRSFFEGEYDGLLEILKKFRSACERVHAIELNAYAHGHAIA